MITEFAPYSFFTCRGFQDEVHEIIKSCPTERQTLLFSATMGTKVDDLIKLSLKRPVRVRVSDKGKEDADETHVEVAHRLEQEFVRIRSGNEGIKREAILLALLTRTYTSRTIVFFDTKVDAHRMMIVCGLCGIKCTELHGNLTQIQRLEALESFREGEVTVLLCTDLAARGLDIHGVDAVINFEMPTQIESYVHRIGRTARAGKCGRSCTLIGETRRHLMKDVIKDAEQKRLLLSQANGKDSSMSSSGIIRSRTVPPSVVDHFASKIKALETHIKEVLSAEAVAKMDRIAEMEATRAKNIIENFQDIQSKPAREWHIRKDIRTDATPSTNQDRIKKNDHLSEAGTGTHRMTRKKRRMKEMREYIDKSRREEENNQEDDELNNKPPRRTKLMSDSLVKATARAQKRQLLDNIHVKEEKSIYEENVEKEKRRKSSKVAGDSLGSGGLFQEDMIAYERKSAKTPAAVAPSMYSFRGYDPNKTKSIGKKKSVHSFKSKSKFNRRK
jgi:ATP-dependent RNA helicase DDX27